jgi:hypothetical protein
MTFKGRRRAAGQCYGNCARMVFDNAIRGDGALVYVEGFVSSLRDYPYLIQHAWIARPDGSIIDPTLRDEDTCCCLFFGVAFSTRYLGRTVSRNRSYGLLDPLQPTFLDLTQGREVDWQGKVDAGIAAPFADDDDAPF